MGGIKLPDSTTTGYNSISYFVYTRLSISTVVDYAILLFYNSHALPFLEKIKLTTLFFSQ